MVATGLIDSDPLSVICAGDDAYCVMPSDFYSF